MNRYCILLLFFPVVNGRLGFGRFSPTKPKQVEGKEGFLYVGRNDSSPVIDYESSTNDAKPAFLYASDTGPRVVEFYAPWCPHCQHFRTKYISYAERVTKVLETSPIPLKETEKVKFYAVSCTMHSGICRDFSINGFPRIKLFPPGVSEPTEDIYPKMMHPFELLHELGVKRADQLDYGKVTDKDLTEKRGTGVSPVVLQTLQRYRTKQEAFSDAFLSFRFSLGSIYSSHGALPSHKKEALHRWLQLLEKTTPPTTQIGLSAKTLLDNFQAICRSEDDLVRALNHLPKPEPVWSKTCSKGQVNAGYTCGLWGLFHMVTIGLNEWNSEPSHGVLMSAKEGAEVIKGFIEHFFGCDECRTNFLKSYDSCEFGRCALTDRNTPEDWMQLGIWLFDFHNAVNVRLERERFEREGRSATDDDLIAVRWPSRKSCPHCWNEHGEYKPTDILKYLRIMYWTEDSVSSQLRDELGIVQVAKEIEDTTPQSFSAYLLPTLVGIAAFALIRMFLTGRRKRSFHKD